MRYSLWELVLFMFVWMAIGAMGLWLILHFAFHVML
jgi:hypothetical protein